jgi:hypothetical protein
MGHAAAAARPHAAGRVVGFPRREIQAAGGRRGVWEGRRQWGRGEIEGNGGGGRGGGGGRRRNGELLFFLVPFLSRGDGFSPEELFVRVRLCAVIAS